MNRILLAATLGLSVLAQGCNRAGQQAAAPEAAPPAAAPQASAPVAPAAPAAPAMPGMPMPGAPAGQAATYNTTGQITAIAGSDVTISHQPVAALGWPAMTMTFKAPDPEMLSGVKEGSEVAFSFRE